MSRSRFCASALVLGISTVASLLAASPAMAQTATYSVVANFTDGAEGGYPVTALIQGANGNFYGSDSTGGPNNAGVVYQMTPSGTLSLLWQPPASCTTNCILPAGALTQGSDGNFYGVTETGGSNSSGSIFKITPSGTFTILYSFMDSTDGDFPSGPLVEGSDGYLYGVASQGGLANGCPNAFGANGCGTVFKIALSGSGFKVVYTFQGTDADSGYPSGGLVQGSDGNFYGTTGGTVFKVTPGGTLTTIASISSSADGVYLNGPLAEGADGAFYGTTSEGGNDGYGTIFKASASGGFTLLYTFTGQADGGASLAGLWAGTDGNFYGTTSQGGNLNCAEGFGCGTIFAMTTAGQPTTLYTFGTQSAGVLGGPAVTQGSNGSLYGTAGNGGSSSNCGDGCGTVFDATVSPAMPVPVALTLSASSVAANTAVTLSYKVSNAITTTAQQCYAFVQGGASGAGTWTGKQTGSYSSSTHAYTGSASITPTAQGTYTYALTCGGTVSGFATLTVTAGGSKSSSTTTLTVTPSAPTVGQSVSLKAAVTGSKGTPTGSVTFYDGSTSLTTLGLNSSGDATLTASTNGLPTGTYQLSADYGGSSTYDTSKSSTVAVTLNKAPTATTLTASPTSVTPPADVTLTATVKRSTSGATGTPTGSVTFYANGSDALATVALKNGVATITASTKPYPAGKYSITAKYLGDSGDVTSTSSAVMVTLQ